MSDEEELLPTGWESTSIGDVTHRKVDQIERSGPLTYIDIGCVGNQSKSIEEPNRLGKDDKIPSRARQVVSTNDVLVSMTRPNLNAVAIVPQQFDNSMASTGFDVLRPFEVEPRWLFNIVKSNHFIESMSEIVQGALYPAVRPSDIREFKIPLPPLAEQRRIVAKIEALQDRSRRARVALAEVGPLLEQFRQSLLAAAFRGDLTADWRAANPNVEPASELLNRIRQERRQKWEQSELAKYKAKGKQPTKGWRHNYQEPEPIDVSQFPNLPEGWCWCRLGMLGTDPVSTVQTGPFGAQLHTEEFVELGVPVIAVGNLTGVGFTKKHLYYITHEKAQQLSRYDVHAGDLLFARSGATLGKVCVAPDFVRDWRMTGHILRARLNVNFVLPAIAVYALWGDSTVKKIVNEGIRGMTRPGYNTSLLNAIPIPLPPISEQRRMLTVIEEAFDVTESLLAQKADSETDLTQLDQSILAKAFRGELVPQDPNDEPASELLARIRNARDKSAQQKNSKPREVTKHTKRTDTIK